LGEISLINKYMRNPTDIKTAHIIISKLPLYDVFLIKITVLIKAIIKII